MTSAADNRGDRAQYTLDAMGNHTREEVKDARGNATGYQYDALRRLTQVTQVSQADGKVQTFSYDGTGAGAQTGYLREVTDSSGSTQYQRDAFGRITSKTQFIADDPGVASNYTTRYAYGSAGELSQISYPSGLRIDYRRNASGQITGIDSQQPGSDKPIVPFVSELAYTALGQPRSWRWASGDTAARAFDADGRMAGNEFASYSFDTASRITAITQSLWAGADGGAQYKAAYTWLVGYDRRGRITGFTRPGQQTSYSYDANGNRLSAAVKTDSGAGLDGEPGPSDTAKTSAQALTVDSASNRLLGFVQTHSLTKGSQSLTSATSPLNFSLDAGGNLTHDGASGFDYDSANRPAQARIRQSGEAFKIAYLHNALGQRVFKSEAQAIEGLPNEAELGAPFIAWLKARFGWLFAPAQSNALLGQSYVYGALPGYALLGEYGNGGNASASSGGSAEYIWLPTDDGQAVPVGVVRGGQLYAVHTDHLATPRLITDSANKAVWQWPYSSFGDNQPTGVLQATPSPSNNNAALQATKPALVYNLRHAGQYFDEETALLQNYFRSYQAAQGRYTQSDPIGLDGGWNPYQYANASPLLYTDPLGLRSTGWPWLDRMLTPYDTSQCATAECAAGFRNTAPTGNTASTEGLTCTARVGVGLGVTASYNTERGLTYLGVGPQAGLSVSITGGGQTLITGSGAQGVVVQASGAFGNGVVGVSGNTAVGTGGTTSTASPGVGTIGMSVGVTMGYRR